MKENIINFFPGANTCQGFFSFFKFLPWKTEQVYIIKGGPGTGKSTFMKKIGEDFVKMGFDIEKHWCASDPESLDGLRIPSFSTAFLDGTAPHTVDPVYPGAVEEIINFGRFWDKTYLIQQKENIIRLNKEIQSYFNKAYYYLRKANLFKNEIETIYQQNFYPEKAKNLVHTIIKKIPANRIKNPRARHLFGSGITPAGLINYYENITEKCQKRFLIQGPFATGKSNMLKNTAQIVSNYGYEILYLHCSLNPENIDALIIPALKLAAINNSFPHTVINGSKDTVLNIMEYVNKSDINQDEIEEYNHLYNKYINKTIEQLKKEKETHDKLEKYYLKIMDFAQIEEIRKNIMLKIIAANSK